MAAEEPGDLLQLHLERLIEEAATYQNSRVGDAIGEEWIWYGFEALLGERPLQLTGAPALTVRPNCYMQHVDARHGSTIRWHSLISGEFT